MSKKVHFIGIGGIGISSLAQWYLKNRWTVSGSDLTESDTTRALQKLGAKIKIGHKKENLPKDAELVIHTQAIKQENPELREAKRRRIRTVSYPQALGELTRRYDTIAIAGMHGKSTTTALTALILAKARFDPTVIIGTKLKEFHGNFRNGKSKYLVIEADEYGGAFLNYAPLLSIVTNIDREHLDYFKNLETIKKAFLTFLSKTRRGGAFIVNKDNTILASLRQKIERISHEKNLKVIWYSDKEKLAKKIRAKIKIPGKHNISNALAAIHAGMFLGVSQKTALQAISTYHGSWRRMEFRGDLKIEGIAVKVFDDYGHHPTEIQVTLQAFREKFPKAKLVCVFQPHQAERLRALFKEFQTAFNEADATLIMPLYKVPGRDLINPPATSEKLVNAIQKKYPGKPIFYLPNPKNLKNALSTLIPQKPAHDRNGPCRSIPDPRRSAIVVMMGAGDIVNHTASLLR